MSVLRPLPPRPSLEFEHKEAKALLRRLRAGDPNAIARVRARHPDFDASDPTRAKLADAQLTIAREYGFASWPRLVRWFGDVERPRHGGGYLHELSLYDGMARSLVAEHRDRRTWTARLLSAYVPRFFGMRMHDVFAMEVSEDDARLAIARSNGMPSWEALVERTEADVRQRALMESDPMRDAWRAMREADLDALQRVVGEHPELLAPSVYDEIKGRNLLASALNHERRLGREAMRPIVDWLVANGLDLQLVLDRKLCGEMGMEPDTVRWLLERGADPNWIAPSGIPVLEHALLRYWNGEAVDVLAAHAKPRHALWIAAGLGDVDGVRRCLDKHGRPTAAARRIRADFDAVGAHSLAALPDPDDEELLVEALLIAMLNGRAQVIEYMASRGAPVNSLVFGTPLINWAVGSGWREVSESLVRSGADLDLRGWRSDSTAREVARGSFEAAPDDPIRRDIVVLCGMDPDVVLAEWNTRPIDEAPTVHPMLKYAMELSVDDALRLGQTEVHPENLLMGLARCDDPPLSYLHDTVPMDIARFRADMGDRVRSRDDLVAQRDLPLRDDGRVIVEAAFALAAERRRSGVLPYHLLLALVREEDSPLATLLRSYGADVVRLRAQLETLL
ncbi:MAG TPA: Clp protease N-terminal domain-containing protein [Gemmatimonadaceae bacterium]|jgi:hypothetical protein|nr:Clp protease N-terminal domain-containing protein [Gemmatimonadaceae bacterium]